MRVQRWAPPTHRHPIRLRVCARVAFTSWHSVCCTFVRRLLPWKRVTGQIYVSDWRQTPTARDRQLTHIETKCWSKHVSDRSAVTSSFIRTSQHQFIRSVNEQYLRTCLIRRYMTIYCIWKKITFLQTLFIATYLKYYTDRPIKCTENNPTTNIYSFMSSSHSLTHSLPRSPQWIICDTHMSCWITNEWGSCHSTSSTHMNELTESLPVVCWSSGQKWWTDGRSVWANRLAASAQSSSPGGRVERLCDSHPPITSARAIPLAKNF